MSASIIDRRKNTKGRSTVNRDRFLDRVRHIVRENVKDLIHSESLGDITKDTHKKVKVNKKTINEPSFGVDSKHGNWDHILPGNNQGWLRGDKIEKPESQGGGGLSPSSEGGGEDDFIFTLTRDEFLDIFFEDCALPDCVKESMNVMNVETVQRKGFVSEGSPAMLNVVRSMKNAKGRRSALKSLKRKKLDDLLREIIQLLDKIEIDGESEELLNQLSLLRAEEERLRQRIKSVPFLDTTDLRYNNWAKEESPKVQAAMICLMDVSGSMTERKKHLAKEFYLLLYVFLTRNYDKIAIEFITYHTEAHVVDEETFFYGKETGGTLTSEGVKMAVETIKAKYDPAVFNIYLAHAPDGDNWAEDNIETLDVVENQLLPMLQYYAYVQIDPSESQPPKMSEGGDGLWNVFAPISERTRRLTSTYVSQTADIYPAFKELFGKKSSKQI